MFRAYKYRIYPTDEQAVLLNKHFGCARLVYNLALEVKQQAYIGHRKNLSAFDLMKQLPDLKEAYPWIKEVNAQALQNSIVNLDKAYTAFFKHGASYPNKKKKSSRQSFSCPQHTKVNFKGGMIILPKFKEGIKTVFSRQFKGDIKTVTVSKTPTGKFYASILVDTKKEVPNKKLIKENTSIGIDLGLKCFIATSNGEIIDHPKFLRSSMDRLKVLSRRLNKKKKKKGSKNRKKAIRKLAVIHEKIANQRKDFLHKLSSKLISENQTICIEDLNISGMSKRCKPKQDDNGKYLPNGQASKSGLNKSIQDSGWGMFVEFLQYKAEWYGKNVIKIGRFEPSSKLCSKCGDINQTLTLEDREWICANCGTLHERDINAANNIKSFALKNSRKGIPGEPVEQPTLVGAMKQEVSI